MKNTCIPTLLSAGISWDDAHALRRISMTLQRWHELECGDGNDHASWTIARGAFVKKDGVKTFEHDEDGKPFSEYHPHRGAVSYTPIPDREKGAKKRLAAILARYPGFRSYIQGDPRGAALYILRPDDLPMGRDIDCTYSNGIAVYK